jgi:membrane dipeptidase
LIDEDVRKIARAGGVIAIGIWSTVNCFEGGISARDARQAIARSFGVAYQILSAPEFVEEMGSEFDAADHLALGSDFDGATLVPANASAIPWYLEGIAQFELDGRGVFDSAAIERIAGANLFRLLEQALKAQ